MEGERERGTKEQKEVEKGSAECLLGNEERFPKISFRLYGILGQSGPSMTF